MPSSTTCSVPVRALSPLSRALCTQEMRTAGQRAQIDPHVWNTSWHVQSQSTQGGAPACTYLAPSVCKVAISNRRIVGLKDRIVTFTSRKPGSSRPRTTRLDVLACMRRFLHHVLPAGFMKVRHFGFLHAHCRITTDPIRPMITLQTGVTLEQPHSTATTPVQVTCPTCGAPLIVLARVWPFHMAVFETGEDDGVDTSLPWSMLLWHEPGDGTCAL